MTALILHGIQGTAGKHWMQWLHDELVKKGVKVVMPSLPDTNDPSFEEWIRLVDEMIRAEDPSELIVVGHSMGVPTALQVIQNIGTPIKALFSVSGFYRDYGAELNTRFMSQCTIDIAKAKKNIQQSFIFFGDNDPYVPQETLMELATGLGVEPIIIPQGGHLNTSAGYTKFDKLLESIGQVV